MLDNYLKEQYISTTLLKREIDNNKIVQAYLFSGNDINYLLKYAKSFSKEIICSDEDDEQIFNEIDNETYPELKVVRPNGNFIKKEQLLELQKSTMNKPVLGKKIVYIIVNCDKLNASSANSILKFLEEPSSDIIAILLTDNINNVMPTILSRCQIFNLNKTDINEDGNILNNMLNGFNIDNDRFEEILNDSINFIESIENKKINCLIKVNDLLWDKYNDSNEILLFFRILIYFYMDALYIKIGNEIKYFKDSKEKIIEIANDNELEKIIKKIYILEELKNEINYNINTKLLFDKLIIGLGDV